MLDEAISGFTVAARAAAEAVRPARPLGQNAYRVNIARAVLERAPREVPT